MVVRGDARGEQGAPVARARRPLALGAHRLRDARRPDAHDVARRCEVVVQPAAREGGLAADRRGSEQPANVFDGAVVACASTVAALAASAAAPPSSATPAADPSAASVAAAAALAATTKPEPSTEPETLASTAEPGHVTRDACLGTVAASDHGSGPSREPGGGLGTCGRGGLGPRARPAADATTHACAAEGTVGTLGGG